MEDELIELVAKAMYERDQVNDPDIHVGQWREADDLRHYHFRGLARAALEASGHAGLLAACKLMRPLLDNDDCSKLAYLRQQQDAVIVDAAIAKATCQGDK